MWPGSWSSNITPVSPSVVSASDTTPGQTVLSQCVSEACLTQCAGSDRVSWCLCHTAQLTSLECSSSWIMQPQPASWCVLDHWILISIRVRSECPHFPQTCHCWVMIMILEYVAEWPGPVQDAAHFLVFTSVHSPPATDQHQHPATYSSRLPWPWSCLGQLHDAISGVRWCNSYFQTVKPYKYSQHQTTAAPHVCKEQLFLVNISQAFLLQFYWCPLPLSIHTFLHRLLIGKVSLFNVSDWNIISSWLEKDVSSLHYWVVRCISVKINLVLRRSLEERSKVSVSPAYFCLIQ